MSKGFWLVTTTVTNTAFAEYVEAFLPWIESLADSVFAKDLDTKTLEGVGGKLSVIIDFPSKQTAIDSYNILKYNELRKLRWVISTDTNITIMDGSVSDQWVLNGKILLGKKSSWKWSHIHLQI